MEEFNNRKLCQKTIHQLAKVCHLNTFVDRLDWLNMIAEQGINGITNTEGFPDSCVCVCVKSIFSILLYINTK